MSQSLTSQSLLDRFDISSEDLVLLKECGHVLGNKIDSVVDRFYEWLGQQPEFNVFFSSQDTVERVKKLQKVYWADAQGDSRLAVTQPTANRENVHVRIDQHAGVRVPQLVERLTGDNVLCAPRWGMI